MKNHYVLIDYEFNIWWTRLSHKTKKRQQMLKNSGFFYSIAKTYGRSLKIYENTHYR